MFLMVSFVLMFASFQQFFDLVLENQFKVDLSNSTPVDTRSTGKAIAEASITIQSSRSVKIRAGKEKGKEKEKKEPFRKQSHQRR